MSRFGTGLLLLGALVLGCRGPHAESGSPASCTHVQSVREVRGLAICEDVWTCARPPGGRFDRVGLRRLAACEGTLGPVLLYLPGMHMNAELPIQDPRYDLRLYLAQAGIAAWGLDYRTHTVPADATPVDLQTLAAWSAEMFAGDATWAVGFVRGIDSGPLYLAGFSFGAGLAYRVAATQRLIGLLILDGAAGTGREPAGDGPAIDVGGSRLPYADRQLLLQRVIDQPKGPSPLPGFPTAGDALADVLYSSPAFGGNGGLSDAEHGVSDVQVLARLLSSYDRWWPRAALLGDRPGRPAGPLSMLAFASTRMGPAWTERVRTSATTFGGPRTTVRDLPGYGHLDVLVARSAARQVFEPVRAWIMEPSAQ
jgi:hypothetical protein